MYAGVPSDVPTCVSPCVAPEVASAWVRDAESALAIPKSVTTAAPPESRMFSGLMSRWTMPCECAYASARATSRRMLTASGTGTGPCWMRARSECPSTNGIV